MKLVSRLLVVIALLELTSSLSAQDFGGNKPSINWRYVENKQGKIIYPAALDSQARRIADLHRKLVETTPTKLGDRFKPWKTILLGETVIPNAYVRMAPVMSEYFMLPSPNSFSLGSIRWDDNLAIHENRHMQQFSAFNGGFTRVFRWLLGEEGQLLANGMQIPDYFFEGDAIWQETYGTAQGRGRMPYFYNDFKAVWLGQKNYSWQKLRSGSLRHLVPNHYQLGYPLVAYGYEKYGLTFWRKVTEDAVRFKGVFYAFNRAIEKHSGVSYKQFREDALLWTRNQVAPANTPTFNSSQFITKTQKNNVVDYLFPAVIGMDSVLAVKRSYQEIPHFILRHGGQEKKIGVQDITTDHYFTTYPGRVLYAALQRDARFGNTEYSVIQLLDLNTGKRTQITQRSRYYAPVFNPDGTEILAVHYEANLPSALHRLQMPTGQLIAVTPNPERLVYTQTRYLNEREVVSAVRLPDGRMTLAQINLTSGASTYLVPPSFQVMGNPLVQGDTIYFNRMDGDADRLFALVRSTKQVYRLNHHAHSVYGVAADHQGNLISSAYTIDGQQLIRLSPTEQRWEVYSEKKLTEALPDFGASSLQQGNGVNLSNRANLSDTSVSKSYKKTAGLFNLHSWRPEAADPEFRYTLSGDQVLSGFSSRLSYTFNRSDLSHGIGGGISFGGWLPVLQVSGDATFNRQLDTAVGKTVQFNTAGLSMGGYIPLRWIGRGTTALTLGGSYTWEQLFYRGIGKDIFNNRSLKYSTFFLQAFHASQQAVQQINPRWAQSMSLSFRQAHTFVESWKFVANSRWYFPGLHRNHSVVIDVNYQRRDTMRDLFSNTFNYARGYLALSTRQMQHVGVNYHVPLAYPEVGLGNIAFVQRVRANLFFDYTRARARVQGILRDIDNRSAGAEIYLDGKIWNALPASIGVRYSYLLDTDLRAPNTVNRWEVIIPINIIPD